MNLFREGLLTHELRMATVAILVRGKAQGANVWLFQTSELQRGIAPKSLRPSGLRPKTVSAALLGLLREKP